MEEKQIVEEQAEAKKKRSKKSIFNIVFTVIQIALIAICLVASIFIITNPGGYRESAEDCNTNVMVVMSDSMTPTIGSDAIIFGSKVPNGVLPLGTVVTFSVSTYSGYFLNTHRIVGYHYHYIEDGKQGESKVYYVKGEMEDYEDFLALKGDKNWELLGYVTRGDKYTLEAGASLDDCRIFDSDGNIDYLTDDSAYRVLSFKDDGTVVNDDVLAIWKGGKIEGIGTVIKFLQKPLYFALCILLPLVLLFGYNIFLMIKMIIADKSEKAKKAAIEEMKNNQLDEEEIKRRAVEEYLASLKKQEGSEEEPKTE